MSEPAPLPVAAGCQRNVTVTIYPVAQCLSLPVLARCVCVVEMAEELPGFIPRVLRREDVSLLRADEAVFTAMLNRDWPGESRFGATTMNDFGRPPVVTPHIRSGPN